MLKPRVRIPRPTKTGWGAGTTHADILFGCINKMMQQMMYLRYVIFLRVYPKGANSSEEYITAGYYVRLGG